MACAIASDLMWAMVRQSVASKCVYTSATWVVPIHIPDVRKQYAGFQNWTSPCFMYVQGTFLLVFLTWHLLKFLLGKYSVWKLKKDFDFQKTNTTGLIFKKSSKTGYQYNYICLPANNMSFEWIIQYLLWKLNNIDCVPNERDFEKKFTLFIIHVRKIWVGGKKTTNSFNLVHSGDCFSPWCTILSSPNGIILGVYHLILYC